jgi:hypothetical protein
LNEGLSRFTKGSRKVRTVPRILVVARASAELTLTRVRPPPTAPRICVPILRLPFTKTSFHHLVHNVPGNHCFSGFPIMDLFRTKLQPVSYVFHRSSSERSCAGHSRPRALLSFSHAPRRQAMRRLGSNALVLQTVRLDVSSFGLPLSPKNAIMRNFLVGRRVSFRPL